MREILFKAKRKNWRELPKDEWWVEGYPVKYQPCASKDEYVYGICPTYASALYIIEIDPETLCQFTGKMDEGGEKIFDKDIVCFIDITSTESGYSEHSCVGQVLWDEEECCFHVTDRLSAESWEVLNECKVIGNVFDDKELLEEF